LSRYFGGPNWQALLQLSVLSLVYERAANVPDSQWDKNMTRPKKSLHFLLISPISNLHFILNPKYCLLFYTPVCVVERSGTEQTGV
jgi:hypothetical protein